MNVLHDYLYDFGEWEFSNVTKMLLEVYKRLQI